MRKLIATVMVLSAGLWIASCTEPATDADIKEMCEHLNKVSAEFDATPAEERVAKVEADSAEQRKAIETKRDEELAVFDKERDGKLGAVKKDEEKAAIGTEYDGKKAEKTAEFQAMIDKLNADKAAMIKQAEEKAKADADAAKQAVDKCVAEAEGIGVSKEIAQCRIAVATADEYWNKCK